MLFIILGLFTTTINFAYSQDASLATFQETAQVLIDKRTQNVTSSITLQTTSVQEIKIPSDLEERIRENSRITSVIITNEDKCVLGVFDESCIIINVKRDPADKGIIEIQDSAKAVGELFIDDLNQVFDTNAQFHSVFVHSDNEMNRVLDTTGVVSGRGIISAVYTMPMEDSDSMYEKISAILIPKIIRDSGGFYETARSLSAEENSKVTFSIIPLENNSLLQLKLSVNYPEAAQNITKVEPLDFLATNELKRSEYFSSGFYPLNSIFQIVILSNESLTISNIKGPLVPTQIIDGEKIPTEFTTGWVFDPEEGEKIQGEYIFGKDTSITKNELVFFLGDELTPPDQTFDESIVIVAIIIIGGVAAAIFFLKGYKK